MPCLTTRRPMLRNRRGMTLIELLLSVSITAIVGAAIAAMLSAVSYGTDSSKDMRSLVARNKVLSSRIGASVRSSRMVLDQGSGFLVLWMDDTDENDQPSLLEIRRIHFDAAGGTLSSYTAPAAATDVLYQLTDDFDATTTTLMGSASFVEELWGTGLLAWPIVLDNADPQAADLISYQVTRTAGDMEDTAIAAVSLRN